MSPPPAKDPGWTSASAPSASGPGGGGPSAASRMLTCGGLCSVESLRPYFDVDTSDVLSRAAGAVRHLPSNDGFRRRALYADGVSAGTTDEEGGGTEAAPSGVGKGPDLYGPVWLSMTLAFVIAVTSNLSLYAHHATRGDPEEEWEYDIGKLLRAVSVVYAFSTGLPAALSFAIRILGIERGDGRGGLAELVCVYGYSLVGFVPAAVLCVAPVDGVKWTALLVATAMSGVLVLRNVAGPIIEGAVAEGSGGGGGMGGLKGKGGGLILAIVACHFVFMIVVKLTFYHHR